LVRGRLGGASSGTKADRYLVALGIEIEHGNHPLAAMGGKGKKRGVGGRGMDV
jgi:hypothetical protein